MKLNIEVINRQRKTKLSLRRLRTIGKKIFQILMESQNKKLSKILKHKNITYLSVSIVLLGNKKMRELNFKYRGKNTTTDVLTFPYVESFLNEIFLGEIFINPERVKFHTSEYGLTLWQKITRVLVHGILHLIGYDHDDVFRAKRMQKLEEKILNKL